MNRRLAIGISVLLTSLTCTAQAEPGPFVSVPASSWSYVAVRELGDAGYFTGYPAAAFRDGRALTRFDFAVALQRMSSQLDRRVTAARAADPAARAALQHEIEVLERLTYEFGAEYAALGDDAQQLSRRLVALSSRLSAAKPVVAPAAPGHGQLSPLGAGPRSPRLFERSPEGTPGLTSSFGARRWQMGLLPEASNTGMVGAGPFGFSLSVLGPEPLSQPAPRLSDPAATAALDARLSLPLGQTQVSGFYKRVGSQFQGDGDWMASGYRGARGLEGFGGGVRAPLGRMLSLDLEGAALHPGARDLSGQVLFVHSGVNVALGRALTVDLGYDRMQSGSGALASPLAEEYDVGVGHAFGRNTRLELLYQFRNLRHGLDGDAAPPDTTYSALGQFRVRF